jgi:hypothetical protein
LRSPGPQVSLTFPGIGFDRIAFEDRQIRFLARFQRPDRVLTSDLSRSVHGDRSQRLAFQSIVTF